MNKNKKFFVVPMMGIIFSMCLSGCALFDKPHIDSQESESSTSEVTSVTSSSEKTNQLDKVSNIEIDPDTKLVTWDPVSKADSYILYINHQIHQRDIEECQFNLGTFNFSEGENSISIVANSNDMGILDSEESVYNFTTVKATVSDLKLTKDTLTWNGTGGVYRVVVVGFQGDIVHETSYRINRQFIKDGDNTISVVPIGNGVTTCQGELASLNFNSNDLPPVLAKVTNLKVSDDGKVTFDKVEHASKYKYSFNGYSDTFTANCLYLPKDSIPSEVGEYPLVIEAIPESDLYVSSTCQIVVEVIKLNVTNLAFTQNIITWASNGSYFEVDINGQKEIVEEKRYVIDPEVVGYDPCHVKVKAISRSIRHIASDVVELDFTPVEVDEKPIPPVVEKDITYEELEASVKTFFTNALNLGQDADFKVCFINSAIGMIGVKYNLNGVRKYTSYCIPDLKLQTSYLACKTIIENHTYARVHQYRDYQVASDEQSVAFAKRVLNSNIDILSDYTYQDVVLANLRGHDRNGTYLGIDILFKDGKTYYCYINVSTNEVNDTLQYYLDHMNSISFTPTCRLDYVKNYLDIKDSFGTSHMTYIDLKRKLEDKLTTYYKENVYDEGFNSIVVNFIDAKDGYVIGYIYSDKLTRFTFTIPNVSSCKTYAEILDKIDAMNFSLSMFNTTKAIAQVEVDKLIKHVLENDKVAELNAYSIDDVYFASATSFSETRSHIAIYFKDGGLGLFDLVNSSTHQSDKGILRAYISGSEKVKLVNIDYTSNGCSPLEGKYDGYNYQDVIDHVHARVLANRRFIGMFNDTDTVFIQVANIKKGQFVLRIMEDANSCYHRSFYIPALEGCKSFEEMINIIDNLKDDEFKSFSATLSDMTYETETKLVKEAISRKFDPKLANYTFQDVDAYHLSDWEGRDDWTCQFTLYMKDGNIIKFYVGPGIFTHYSIEDFLSGKQCKIDRLTIEQNGYACSEMKF